MFLVRAPVFEGGRSGKDSQNGDGVFKRFLQATRWSTPSKDPTSFSLQLPRLRGSVEPSEAETRKQVLRANLQNATDVDQWRAAGTELDELEGYNEWKQELESPEYNYRVIESRLNDLEDARMSGDAERMLFLVRTSLTRHLGGMDNLQLYKRSHVGTKRLIESYINSALATISTLLEVTNNQRVTGLQPRQLLDQFLAARQSFGRSALLLSGGGTLGMNHIGVVKCLWEARLLPRIISGSSAGSIVASVLCARSDEELPETLEQFCYGELDVFTKTGEGDTPFHNLARLLKIGAFFDIANLMRVMQNMLGDMTFQEAYNRTRRILNICVSSAGTFELPRLLNYVTAPNVVIWSAVAASCSVPVVFQAPPLLAKDPKTGLTAPWNPSPQRWIDGSVDGDIPMQRLSEMFNVNHFIVSQVNPHVVPFLPRDMLSNEPTKQAASSWTSQLIPKLSSLARDETLHRMQMLSELGVFPTFFTKTRSILSQRYVGDITIFPAIEFSQFVKVLQNPTSDFMIRATICGERATWPKLSAIQHHCAIELALDDAVVQLRSHAAFSPSQTNLRLTGISRSFTMSAEPQLVQKDSNQRKKLKLRPVIGADSMAQQVKSASSFIGPLPHTSAPAIYVANPLAMSRADVKSPDESETERDHSPTAELPGESAETTEESEADEEVRTRGLEQTTSSLSLWPSASTQRVNHISTPNTPMRRFASPSSYFTMISQPGSSANLSSTAVVTPGSPQQNFLSRSATLGERGIDGLQRRRTRSGSSSGTVTPTHVELDMSGTKGMVLRKKQLSFSMSQSPTARTKSKPEP